MSSELARFSAKVLSRGNQVKLQSLLLLNLSAQRYIHEKFIAAIYLTEKCKG